ncbi:lamina-associated polypeptide 2-like isoform X2 [Erythrolamprus reginae]|uniref:lamina-associated polypeptide 2-like isoform X2 n=1 Tax=Erythrolamprus reginae TaxID=121349 RepID=UPI00396C460A
MEPSAEGDSRQGNERPSEPAPKREKPTLGRRPRETQEPEITPQMRLMITEAIARGIVAGVQKKQQGACPAPDKSLHQGKPTAPDNSEDPTLLQSPHSPASSRYSQKTLWGNEEEKELRVSEEKAGAPERPAFTGLFNPDLFKTLLSKAKATTGIGADPAVSDPSLDLSDPKSLVSSEPASEKEEIPTPKLFLDFVQQQWIQSEEDPLPSMKEKRFYNVDPNLRAALEIPTIDGPVVSLASPKFTSGDTDDALKEQDRGSEVTLRKVHQAAAWAVKSALAASFFNRTSLLWLEQLQSRIPDTDLCTFEDIKKLVAAAEFSADATLNSAKFASRSLASSLTVRRLLWLRYWQADMKYKWKLASSPYTDYTTDCHL